MATLRTLVSAGGRTVCARASCSQAKAAPTGAPTRLAAERSSALRDRTHREAPRAEHVHEVHAHCRPRLTEEHAGTDHHHHAHRPPPRGPAVSCPSCPCNAGSRVARPRTSGDVRSARQAPRIAARGHRRLPVELGCCHRSAIWSDPYHPLARRGGLFVLFPGRQDVTLRQGRPIKSAEIG